MDFEPSAKAKDYIARLTDFMDAHVYPAEPVYAEQLAGLEAEGRGHELPPIVQNLNVQAQERGLWNLFLPDESGLSVTDYAPLAEISGRSPHLAPEVLNCSAPDTGNMEVLHMFGTPAQ